MGDAVKVTVIATGIKSERMGIKPLPTLSRAVHSAQQSVKNRNARKEVLPLDAPPPPTVITAGEVDLDVPTFIRVRKDEKK
jgi:hypothetical protein